MTPQVTLDNSTIERMKLSAEPLVDTFDTVIHRALDALEALKAHKPDPSGVRTYNPASPPPLAFTTVKSIKFNGAALPPADVWWNPFMFLLIREARKNMSIEEVSKLLFVNHVKGEKQNGGYKVLEDIGLSIQGQDANNAWKQCYELLKALKLPAEITFAWQENPKASHPGEMGKFVVEWQ
jgi:hypothetical protein